jgi:hypothetical protein
LRSKEVRENENASETTGLSRRRPIMAKKQIPAPPRGTGVNGAKLWRDVLGKYELEEHELALLREIPRTADLLDKLHAITSREGVMVSGPRGSKPHPAVTEARQARIALARLTAALRLPAGDEGNPPAHRRPAAGRDAWGVWGGVVMRRAVLGLNQ